MSLIDALPEVATANDFTLLEGLFQLTIAGHTDDWQFERLNNAVYERLMSSYTDVRIGSAAASQSMMA